MTLAVALAAACSAPHRFTGIVVNVAGDSPASVESVTVRADDGTTIVFEVGRLDVNNGLPAAHLREHVASGAPIVVDYVVENGRHVALRYNDAP